MNPKNTTKVSFLKLSLHGHTIGHLAGYQDGQNILTFDEEFKNNTHRPSFSLITHTSFPNAQRLMSRPWIKRQRLHPVLSNLLPEGALRELMAQNLKTHVDNEFEIFSSLGRDLPGALIATPIGPEDVPQILKSTAGGAKIVKLKNTDQKSKFSLAGVQMKFSMKEIDGRYNLSDESRLGDWIIKTPSTKHKDVPLNEYTSMSLADLAGVNIPPIKLIEIDKIDDLPQINLPNEQFAFAIKRFDRKNNQRIHAEDFAQVLVKYPHEKYSSASYEQIGNIIFNYSGDGLADVQQFARRLLVNILLANGDAHLKNWSLIYQDQITPRLAPAYDIVCTSVYMTNETDFGLNLAKNKNWFKSTHQHFEDWSRKVGVPWRAIKGHLQDTVEKARALWPKAIRYLPMNEGQKIKLKEHWSKLHSDFQIKSKWH